MFYEQQTFHVVFCPYWCEKGGKMHGFEKKVGLGGFVFHGKVVPLRPLSRDGSIFQTN